ncbi:MAG: glutamate mutase L [Anaerolineales bacterium]
MPVSLLEDSSLLAVNVGTSTTRAALFDVVDGEYRFLAQGQAPSTAEAPFKDVSLGVRQAIANLQAITGRVLLDADQQLIKPTQLDGSGVDALAVTLSAGPILRAVVVGLLSDVSLESARKLAETAYLQITETIDLNDHRRADEQIDAILRARPDVILLAGGTDGGASRSIQKILEAIGLACYLTPPEKRPSILFAGNHSLTNEIKSSLEKWTTSLHISPNIRPSLETEDLTPAARELAQVFVDARKRQVPGVAELAAWSGGHILPTAYAEGRIIRFLSQMSGSSRGILGVDIGATATMVAAALGGELTLGVYPQFGVGENLPALLHHCRVEDIVRWMQLDIAPSVVRDYLYQYSLFPGTLPTTQEEYVIAQAISRQALYLAIQTARKNFPRAVRSLRSDLLPFFEPILAAGGVMGDAHGGGQSLLLLLDAIQPVGITSIILDQNNLLPLLGAAAEFNPLLPVQILESGAFMSLGTVVSVVGEAPYGTPILRARLTYADGSDARLEVKFGGLEVLPLAPGQTARLTLQPRHHADIGNGPGRNAAVQVTGGTIGVVFDARGRPLELPNDPVRRRELLKKWNLFVGG